MNLSARSYDLETMDDLNCSGEVVRQTLRELEFINKWLGGNHVTLNAMKILAAEIRLPSPLRIADLGCGSGEMLKLIDHWANRNQITTTLTGIDANPNIINLAVENCRGYDNISLHAEDIFSDSFKQMKFDIVIGTLFFHHFSDLDLINFFAQLKNQVTTAIIINDIHRHSLAYYSIKWLTQFFSRSEMVKHDAPLSVRRAFSRKEMKTILEKAGYENFTIEWKWAFRWQVIIVNARNEAAKP